MNILTRNLFLTLGVFVNFRELNSSPAIYGEGSSRPHWYKPQYSQNEDSLLIEFRERQIKVIVDVSREGHITPISCTLLGYPQKGVPNREARKTLNFYTRALVIDHVKYCVAYVTGDGEVLGVKIPPTHEPKVYGGHPCNLNPDESTWYISYGGLDFKVTEDPLTHEQLNIELLPNNRRPTKTYMLRYKVKSIEVHFADLYFLMYRKGRENGKDEIVGAALNPDWLDRVPQTE